MYVCVRYVVLPNSFFFCLRAKPAFLLKIAVWAILYCTSHGWHPYFVLGIVCRWNKRENISLLGGNACLFSTTETIHVIAVKIKHRCGYAVFFAVRYAFMCMRLVLYYYDTAAMRDISSLLIGQAALLVYHSKIYCAMWKNAAVVLRSLLVYRITFRLLFFIVITIRMSTVLLLHTYTVRLFALFRKQGNCSFRRILLGSALEYSRIR